MLNPMTAMAAALREHLPNSLKAHSSNSGADEDIRSFYTGHVAAITGAGSGIGRALAMHLAQMGCEVALADITPDQLVETQKLIEKFDVKSTITVLDVSDKDAVYAWAENVMSDHGKVNFIFNNAGVAMYSTVEGSSIEDLEWVMAINFWGVVYGTKTFLPLIKRSVKLSETKDSAAHADSKSRQFIENGHIVNISSLFGLTAQPSQSAYNASKFAVRGFTESLRQELNIQQCGVSATCIHPGGIRTNIANSARGNDSIHDIGMGTGASVIKEFNKFLKFDADDAAWVILAAAATNQPRLLIGNDAKIIDAIQRLFPTRYSHIVTDIHHISSKLKSSKLAKSKINKA